MRRAWVACRSSSTAAESAMSRIRLLPIRLLPAALAAALVMLGSTTLASAQYYSQSPSYDQSTPQDQNVQTDPPDRAARLAYLTGDVEFAPAGEDDWGNADINRPLITGDRLMTGSDGRAALELGDAALRLNDNSAFNFLDLNDTTTQVELSQGTLNLRVRTIGEGQTYEVDTPTVAFVAGEPGTYRIDVAPDGNGAMVTVFEGSGTVYGENGISRPVQAGQSYRFNDSSLANVQVQRVPAPDDFDRFSQSRDSRYTNSVSRRYVAPEVVGYEDLDQYGDWQNTSDYGEVWYPSRVATGWAPYRDGHWAWIEPWGWTWVDDEPWGYAPFHYGRWVYVRDRWGWMPGPRTVRPVYAPALVAFVGGSGFSISIGVGGGGGYGQPVGWFPLGPRDVYVPPYRASRNYFTNINVTNIRNVYVNKTVINNYYGNYAAGRPYAGAREYAYRNNPRAFTAVPRNVFASAKPVRPAVLRVKPNVLARATVTPIPHVAPTRASLAIKPPKRPIAKPVARAFDRTVIARHAPPARPVPFAAREKVIAKQGGAPIPVAQLQKMRQQHAKAQPERVRVVAPAAKPGAPARAGQPVVAPRQQPTAPQEQRKGERPRASIHPIQVPVNPPKGASRNAPRQEPQRPGELPSARFAHPQRGAAPPAEQRATQNQQGAGQQRANRQQQQAQQEQQRADQERQRAEQQRANRQQQQAQQAQQRTEQERGNQQKQQQAQQEQQRADQARQRAEQERANRQQRQAQQAQQRTEQERANRQRQQAQQEQQRADQARQRAEQERANRQQQQQAQQEQQRADQARQRAEQERANRQQRQAQQEQQRAEQERSNRQRQHAQQDQQRARQAQMQQQREAQVRAQEQQRASQARTQQQRQQHAPPPPQERKKKKDHDQQDNGGH